MERQVAEKQTFLTTNLRAGSSNLSGRASICFQIVGMCEGRASDGLANAGCRGDNALATPGRRMSVGKAIMGASNRGMALSDRDKAEVKACIDRGEPLPERFRWMLFAEPRETELIDGLDRCAESHFVG